MSFNLAEPFAPVSPTQESISDAFVAGSQATTPATIDATPYPARDSARESAGGAQPSTPCESHLSIRQGDSRQGSPEIGGHRSLRRTGQAERIIEPSRGLHSAGDLVALILRKYGLELNLETETADIEPEAAFVESSHFDSDEAEYSKDQKQLTFAW